jgi:hypothetical protein
VGVRNSCGPLKSIPVVFGGPDTVTKSRGDVPGSGVTDTVTVELVPGTRETAVGETLIENGAA